jgi:antitoxin HicB
MNKSHIGSNFDDFLRDEKLLDAVEAAAVKRVLAFQVAQEMKQRQLSKTEMASRMKTSRAAVERLLDPDNTSITLATLGRAAAALGKYLSVGFTERKPMRRSAQAVRGTLVSNRTSRPEATDRSKSTRSRS